MDLFVLKRLVSGLIIDEIDFHMKMIPNENEDLIYDTSDQVQNILPCLNAVPSTGVFAMNMYTFVEQGLFIKFQSVSCPPPPG